jgi:type I restriction enzyme S subunit
VDKKGKVLSDTCIQDEVPFEIPNTWTWVRLGSIGTTETGKTPPTGNRSYYRGNIPFVTPGDITYSHRLYATARHLSTSGLERSRKAAPGSVLQVCIGGSSGKTCLIDFDCAFNQQINHVSCTVSEVGRYLYCVLISPLIQNRIKQIGSGTATPITNKTKWESFLIPLPPLAEQQRIVDRVRDLLPLVEEYGELEDEREALDQVLPDRLRKSVLQQAVEGKLVAQDPADEDASILVERIRKEKRRLIAEGKAKFPKGGESVIYVGSDGCHYEKHIDKKGKVISETCIQDEVPFEIPNTWTWARLDSVSTYIQRGKSPKYSLIERYPVVSQKCNQWSGFSIEKARFVDADFFYSCAEERLLQNGDLLWNSTGIGTLGRMAVYDSSKNPYGTAIADSHVTVIRAVKDFVCSSFAFFYFASPSVQHVIEKQASGSTKQKELSQQTVKNYLTPLPPLAEQQRIVERVQELLNLCCE